jgi:hypothetical protein
VNFFALNSASPCGFTFLVAELNMLNILKHTELTLNAGDHSLYNIDKHMNPFE